MSNETLIMLSAGSLVFLTFMVGLRMLSVRVAEMKRRRIGPQQVALRSARDSLLEDARASDNYNHLFELPVLFYALVATALAVGHSPDWLVICSWVFVVSRFLHSAIQLTSNAVMVRLSVFLCGYFVLFGSWGFFIFQILA